MSFSKNLRSFYLVGSLRNNFLKAQSLKYKVLFYLFVVAKRRVVQGLNARTISLVVQYSITTCPSPIEVVLLALFQDGRKCNA